VDVIIPARNESDNIERVLIPFASHPHISQIIVSLDADTTDDTDAIAERYATRIYTGTTNKGKGQCLANALYLVRTPRVIFCDADVTGLTHTHINQLMVPTDGMILGVPDWPTDAEFEATGQPRKWRRRLTLSWGMVTGQRSMPTEFARSMTDLHGYLAETQFNVRAFESGLDLIPVALRGLRSPFQLTDIRLAEMERDRLWGIANGWLPDPTRTEMDKR
jgi:glycosyltransferase involved in cell wall biosynthesis